MCREMRILVSTASPVAGISEGALTGLKVTCKSVGETNCWWGLRKLRCPTNRLPYVESSRWFGRGEDWIVLVLKGRRKCPAALEIVQISFVELLFLRIRLLCRRFLLGQKILWWSLFTCAWVPPDRGNCMLHGNFLGIPRDRWSVGT